MTIISTQYASGIVNATEKAAVAASKLIGLGDEKAADQVAVDAMRTALNEIDFKGRIVIGEGERDEAPMLYIGEEVGSGKNDEVDIALDPLEGTTITAKGMPNSLSVIAAAQTAISTGKAFFVSVYIWSADSTFTIFTFSGFFNMDGPDINVVSTPNFANDLAIS